MKFVKLRRKLSYGMLAIALASSVLLASCGGGGGESSQSAGVGGTGIAAGKTTGFGSIYVNGRKFETDMSRFIVDGNSSATQADLAVGMYVQLRVETLDGNFTGEALEVFYDDEVQGPVTSISPVGSGETQRTFDVFGQSVTIDETDTLFDGTTFSTLADNDVVEISGFRTSDTEISASYVEWKEALVVGSEVELRGIVSGYVPPVPGPESFVLDGIDIAIGGMTVKDLESGMLQDGLYVEVEGEYQNATTVLAREIEEEDQDFGSDVDDISLQGVVSNYNPITGEFEIDGLPIDTSQATELSPANVLDLIDDGVEIEVEGDIEGGVFIADEVELRTGDSELLTTVRFIDLPGNRFQLEYPGQGNDGLGRVWINAGGQTLFEDESAANLPNFSLDQLAVGNFVKVKGIADMGEVSAEIVKRLDLDSSKLEGAVEAFNPDPSPDTSITILGIAYPIDASAIYQDDPLVTRAQFFATPLQIGDIVELEDDEPDGDADEVEFDD